MTLWVHTLEERQLTSHSDDHSLMIKFASNLDAICTNIGLTPLSSFLDYTDLKANMSENADDSEKIDPETGWSYGIDDMTWFSAKDGLSSLPTLRARLAASDAEGIPINKIAELVAELDSCIEKLTEPASHDARFHLAVIM